MWPSAAVYTSIIQIFAADKNNSVTVYLTFTQLGKFSERNRDPYLDLYDVRSRAKLTQNAST